MRAQSWSDMVLNFFNNPTTLIISAIVMIMALIFHNIVQAWVASRLGDASPRLSGFMNFDPQQQLEPFGVLFLFLLGFGWPKQINVNGRNYPGRGRGEAWVWYAGPASFLLVAFACYLAGLLFVRFGANLDLGTAFIATGDIAILHAVINLFPVYPLDGAKAALAWGNSDVRRLVQRVASFGFIGFIVIFMLLQFTGITGAIMRLFRGILIGILGLIPGF
jgi:Zn-dependent protease